MFGLIRSYYHWLHGRWPAGTVEKLPAVGDDGATNIPEVRITGDLTGIPLLKFSADTGARAVQAIANETSFEPTKAKGSEVLDLAIVGGGVSGFAAAREARERGWHFQLFEAQEAFSTIVNFPRRKPIYTYPTGMTPAGKIQFSTEVKEDLLDELKEQTVGIEPVATRIERVERRGANDLALHTADGTIIRAKRAIIAIGRSGNFRKLGVPGEELDKVSNRLHDPADFAGKDVLVVGGGDSALETAIALTGAGAHVTLSYRRKEFSRPKPDNQEKIQRLLEDPATPTGVENPTSERVSTAAHSWMREDKPAGSLKLLLGSQVQRIEGDKVAVRDAERNDQEIANDNVFAMLGREAPLDFFRRSCLNLAGEWGWKGWLGLILFFGAVTWMYHWKAYLIFWPFDVRGLVGVAEGATDFFSTLGGALNQPDFYYSSLYCLLVVGFGVRRILYRKTQYITWQTITLMTIQVIPLWFLPYLLFPYMGGLGMFHGEGFWPWFGETFLSNGPGTEPDQYWRAFGLILAWPLFIYNVFHDQPLWGWIILSVIQTGVIIPLIIYVWGKGAYCGWICSCGALAETMGDRHRHKMPHGPAATKLNMVGQVILWIAVAILVVRIAGWMMPESGLAAVFKGALSDWPIFNYKYAVDLFIAGIIGYGFYFHFSGRVWCRFACPLAALMHIYARFSRFRIFAEKKKCISCNVCTSVCHQGIDIMNFANKGLGMQDPECVRCSACVQSCPTGTLQFGFLAKDGKPHYDTLWASPVLHRESTETPDKGASDSRQNSIPS